MLVFFRSLLIFSQIGEGGAPPPAYASYFIIIVILNSLWPVFILVKIIFGNVLNTGQSIIFFQLIRRISFPVRAAVSFPFFLSPSSS